eukprot:Nk52_evm12s249 gene=Nk52_evmTU12s249
MVGVTPEEDVLKSKLDLLRILRKVKTDKERLLAEERKIANVEKEKEDKKLLLEKFQASRQAAAQKSEASGGAGSSGGGVKRAAEQPAPDREGMRTRGGGGASVSGVGSAGGEHGEPVPEFKRSNASARKMSKRAAEQQQQRSQQGGVEGSSGGTGTSPVKGGGDRAMGGYGQAEFFPTTIYVGDLRDQTGQQDLANVFSRFGEISDIRLISHKHYAFIKFVTAESAAQAIEEMDQQMVCGAFIKCSKARVPDSQRGGGGGGPLGNPYRGPGQGYHNHHYNSHYQQQQHLNPGMPPPQGPYRGGWDQHRDQQLRSQRSMSQSSDTGSSPRGGPTGGTGSGPEDGGSESSPPRGGNDDGGRRLVRYDDL